MTDSPGDVETEMVDLSFIDPAESSRLVTAVSADAVQRVLGRPGDPPEPLMGGHVDPPLSEEEVSS